MARIINGTLTLNNLNPTANPGEYTFTNADFNNQADATANGAFDLAVGFIVYALATDLNSALPVPGVMHRYKLTHLTVILSTKINGTILWDEGGAEVDTPTVGSVAIISEPTPNQSLGLPASVAIYANLPGGADIAAFDADFRSKLDKGLSVSLEKIMTNGTGTPIPSATPIAKQRNGTIIPASAGSVSGSFFCGITKSTMAGNGQGPVLLASQNIANAILGLGFLVGDEIYLGASGGYTTNGASLPYTSSIIKIGIADCQSGSASSTATDILMFSEVRSRP